MTGSDLKKKLASVSDHYIWLAVILVFSFILRIPRIDHAQGQDMFVLVIEAFSVIEGTSDIWLIHPLSFLGMYSFSGYPIGSILLMSFFLQIAGLSIDIATYLYSLLFIVISISTSYKLMQRVFENKREQLLGVAFFQFLPIIYDFTYNTATARASLLALLPLVFYYLLDWLKQKKLVSIIKASVVTVCMMLFHRSAIVLSLLILIALIYPYIVLLIERGLHRIKVRAILFNRLMILGIIGGSGFLFLISIVFEGIIAKNDIPQSLLPDWVQPPLDEILSLGVDYFLFYGPVIVLVSIGLLLIFTKTWSNEKLIFRSAPDWIFLIVLMLPLVYFLGYPAYTRHLLAVNVVLLAVKGTELLTKGGLRYSVIAMWMTIPFILFFQLYNVIWRNIEPYALQSTIFFTGMLVGLIAIPRLWKRMPVIKGFRLSIGDYSSLLILGILLVFTLTNNGMRSGIVVNQTYPYNNTSTDEILVSRFIMEQQSVFDDESIVLSSHFLIELRVAAYAHTNSLMGGHGTAVLLVEYVNQEDVFANSTGDFLENFMRTHIYTHSISSDHLWYSVMTSNFTAPETQQLLENLHVRFFVAIKATSNAFGPRDDSFYSVFLDTLSAPRVFETDHLIVYRLN